MIRNDQYPFNEAFQQDPIGALNGEPRDEDPDSPWDISGSDNESTSQSQDRSAQDAKDVSKPVQPELSHTVPERDVRLSQRSNLEITLLIQSIKHVVSCLYRIPIRRPAPIERLKENATAWSLYQHFDILYVQDKFRYVPVSVARRLGKTISRRRQLLRYRETHNSELRTGDIELPMAVLERPSEEQPDNDVNAKARISQSTNIRKSARSQAPSGRDTLHTKATTLRVANDPDNSFQVLYAPSIAVSKTSVASTSTGRLRVQIPPRPLGNDGKELEEFECPYCFTLVRARTPHQWK